MQLTAGYQKTKGLLTGFAKHCHLGLAARLVPLVVAPAVLRVLAVLALLPAYQQAVVVPVVLVQEQMLA